MMTAPGLFRLFEVDLEDAAADVLVAEAGGPLRPAVTAAARLVGRGLEFAAANPERPTVDVAAAAAATVRAHHLATARAALVGAARDPRLTLAGFGGAGFARDLGLIWLAYEATVRAELGGAS